MNKCVTMTSFGLGLFNKLMLFVCSLHCKMRVWESRRIDGPGILPLCSLLMVSCKHAPPSKIPTAAFVCFSLHSSMHDPGGDKKGEGERQTCHPVARRRASGRLVKSRNSLLRVSLQWIERSTMQCICVFLPCKCEERRRNE